VNGRERLLVTEEKKVFRQKSHGHGHGHLVILNHGTSQRMYSVRLYRPYIIIYIHIYIKKLHVRVRIYYYGYYILVFTNWRLYSTESILEVCSVMSVCMKLSSTHDIPMNVL
jgi:hypothetical protein